MKEVLYQDISKELIAQGYRQEEGVDYDEVFAPVARIEAIRLFLAFASFMGFSVYQMDVKSAFLYGNITEEVYVNQPPAPELVMRAFSTFLLKHGYRRGAIDKTLFIKRDRKDIMLVQVYVDDIIFGSTKTSMVKEFEELMQKEFTMSSMGELTFFLGLQLKQVLLGFFFKSAKYVKDILNKFDFRTIKPATTPIEAHKALGKDGKDEDVDVHLYRSMIGCLMYLTASRPDIMFAVCLCARFQVTPKVSHLNAVKRIFRYLKHQPKLGLWYPKDSPFHLEAFSDSDYAGDNHDRRSTSGGCQYLGRRLVSWQCKKQTIVAISSTEAEYVAAASCYGQVLWMQNQLFDYGFNFMNTDIHIDNESTICIVKNPVFHSKTKHIQIRHHFIRDCYDQRLINVVKGRTACKVWTLKEDLMLFLRGGEYIVVQRANGHIRAFNTLNEVLHILDRQDLHHLHRLVIEYYEHIPPTGLGLILHGDLTTMMETTEESDDELWRNQTEWEIIRWRLYESTGVHILELENGTMIHMLVEQRYPLTRELMQRMLEHKLEVQKETEDALNVIRFVMKQKEDLEREEE
ncbi:putative ribonuclease H-like domain-containing protein [Tanacetum coccineum]